MNKLNYVIFSTLRTFLKQIILTAIIFILPLSAETDLPESKTEYLNIYIDADRSGARNSGIAIERGIRIALMEINSRIQNTELRLVIKDHRGNSRRSYKNLKDFAEDPRGLVLFSGMHSPPVLNNLTFINQEKILLLDPWAAATPITRTSSDEGKNWIFRLSVDDSKAGEFITAYSIDREKHNHPVLLLENTGWGNANKKTMTEALAARGVTPLKIIRFDWNVGDLAAKEILSDITRLKADVIYLVANAPEGRTFVKAMSRRNSEDQIPIRSHWGITGGNFFDSLGAEIITQTDLKFIQTSFSFLNSNLSLREQDIFNRYRELYPETEHVWDLKAPCGFIHSYDLTLVLLEALSDIDLTGDITDIRERLREALERINTPVEGLIKTYNPPFRPYTPEDRDAHEALNEENLRMAYYTEKGGIKILP